MTQKSPLDWRRWDVFPPPEIANTVSSKWSEGILPCSSFAWWNHALLPAVSRRQPITCKLKDWLSDIAASMHTPCQGNERYFSLPSLSWQGHAHITAAFNGWLVNCKVKGHMLEAAASMCMPSWVKGGGENNPLPSRKISGRWRESMSSPPPPPLPWMLCYSLEETSWERLVYVLGDRMETWQ